MAGSPRVRCMEFMEMHGMLQDTSGEAQELTVRMSEYGHPSIHKLYLHRSPEK
jgi:hypothetical protein